MKLTIIIKALNEEEKIAMCIESALRSVETLKGDGEVILADSMSTDETVAIAMRYPIRIVQLVNPDDRGCGAGWQLGYQFAKGEYIWLTDGDMILVDDFANHAISFLVENTDVAGVAGLLIDTHAHSSQEKRRIAYYSKINSIRNVSSLGGGGIFKREAIEDIGYISNRWLHAAEEAELGCRLRAHGWRLVRLPLPMVRHTGRRETELAKQIRLLRSKRQQAYGYLLRYAMGKRWFPCAILAAWFIFIVPMLTILMLGLWVALVTRWGLPGVSALLQAGAIVYVALFTALAFKKKSVGLAAVSMLAYHLNTVAACIGFAKKPKDPALLIKASILKD
jgi:glycosyltransferase involved in cell wall biosynthesis